MGELNNAIGGGGGNPANRKPFTKSGQFVVPDGVKTVYVTAVAGGGGGVLTFSGTNTMYSGTNGGNTKFGEKLELEGGYRGEYGSLHDESFPGKAGQILVAPDNTEDYQFPGGMSGVGVTPYVGEAVFDKATPYINATSSIGGSSCLAAGLTAYIGGARVEDGLVLSSPIGTGGPSAGARSNSSTTSGQGGAGVIDIPIPVTPGEVIDIEIGAGGLGGEGYHNAVTRHAHRGGPGYLLVKW